MNVGTGDPILQRNSKGMLCLFLTRTMRLPWDCIKGIRRSRLGHGTEIVTERGMQTVLDDFEDVNAADQEARAIIAQEAGNGEV
jgi:hypothetical protein